jgi:hypothetical protein
MKTKIIIICLAAAFVVAAAERYVGHPQAKLTVRVLDEQLHPVEHASIRIGFSEKLSDKEVFTEALTGPSGEFSAEGFSPARLSADVRKDGFYLSGSPFVVFTNAEEGRWQPWNPTVEIIMRPVGKSVALYAKTVHTQIPILDQPCGYDLEAGDWVSPYGKGMKKDFIFTIHQKWRGNYDYDVQGELMFKNPLDGLMETSIPDIGKNSVFRWERLAPGNGYEPKFQLQNTWYPSGSGKKPVRSFKSPDVWDGYFFRVRTVEQDGQIVSTHYGKIRGGIAVYPNDPKPKIAFTYYFNPTPNDRNLEWDQKRNLFGGITDMETPREP